MTLLSGSLSRRSAGVIGTPELLRLVIESKSIADFSPALLSKNKAAFAIKADSKENRKIRDEICCKTKADIFIPAGGRPYTIHEKNWQLFLDADGKPTMRAI